jgi:hypothetical protein
VLQYQTNSNACEQHSDQDRKCRVHSTLTWTLRDAPPRASDHIGDVTGAFAEAKVRLRATMILKGTEDFNEGIKAFAEKREPVYRAK